MNKRYTRSKGKKEKSLTITTNCHIPFLRNEIIHDDFGFLRIHREHHVCIDDDDDEDEYNQPPLNRQLKELLNSVPKEQKYYVYDIHNYSTRLLNDRTLRKKTEDTLRIGVLSPIMFGQPQQNPEILQWAVESRVLPTNWTRPDATKADLEDSLRTKVDIADIFVQHLLQSTHATLVRISYHIGEWYNFSDPTSDHFMQPGYELKGLRKVLQRTELLQTVAKAYMDTPIEMIWHIAVFVCHQYFFYLADSEYKTHPLLNSIRVTSLSEPSVTLKHDGNAHHKSQRYDDAITTYTEALKFSPYNHLLYSNRAISYLKARESKYSKRPKEATKYAHLAMSDAYRCIKLEPYHSKGHDRYAMALVALDEPEEAVTALKSAIRNLEKHSFIDKSEIRCLEKRLAEYSLFIKKPKLRTKADSESEGSKLAQKDSKHSAASNKSKSMKKDKSKPADNLELKSTSKTTTSKTTGKSKDEDNSAVGSLQTLDNLTANIAIEKDQVSSSEGLQTNAAAASSTEQSQTPITNKTTEPDTKSIAAKSTVSDGKSSGSKKKLPKHVIDALSEKAAAVPHPDTEIIDDWKRTLRAASEALLDKKYRFAINLYDKCFKALQEQTAVKLSQTKDYVLVVRYARCVAYICVGPNEDIVIGVRQLKQVLEQQPSLTMKAITLYELGRAYARQHRYKDAIELVTESLKLCDGKIGLRDVYCWPGTDTFIQHTDTTVLKENLTAILEECRDPPVADFQCLAEYCTSYGYISHAIYIDDPDFKGYACVDCSEKCHLYFHIDCLKRKHIKVNAKCATPDCDGFVARCIEYDEQVQKCNEIKGDVKSFKAIKDKKMVLKLKPSSAVRIETVERKKQERMYKRAQRQKQALAADKNDDLADRILAGTEKAAEDLSAQEADLRDSNVAIAHKKKEDDMEHLVTRKTTKKPKSRQIMSLEVFYGPSTYDEAGSNRSSGSLPMSQRLLDDVARFEQDHTIAKLPVVIQGISVDQLQETVCEFYYELLESKGPMRADSSELTDFLEYEKAAKELIQHYCGLTRFLMSTGRFDVLENIIYIRRDSDEKRAREMVDAVRTVSHGVSVVPSDFKENLDRASSYIPERKKYSGYEHIGNDLAVPDYDLSIPWRSVIQDWRQCDNLSERERSASTSTSMSEVDSAKVEASGVVVEKLSPTLLEAWKKDQEQKLLGSLEDRTEMDMERGGESERATQPSPTSTSTSEDVVEYVRKTPSADSLVSETNSTSATSDLELVHTATNDLNHGPRATECLAFPSDLRNPSPPSLFSSPPAPYIPATPHYDPMTHTYLPPVAMRSSHVLSSVPSMPPVTVAPIGTPAQYNSTYQSSMYGTPVTQSDMSMMSGYNTGFSGFNSTHWNPSSGVATTCGNSGWSASSCNVSSGTQTEKLLAIDSFTNTEYDSMSDYDKKVEECVRLLERNEDLSDRFTQLRQSSSAELQDLNRRLADAIEAEKAMKGKSDKVQHTAEKETRKWKDEKRSMVDEVNSVKQMCDDYRWKFETKESKYKELEEKFNAQKRADEAGTEEREASIRQYKARLDMMEKTAIDAQMEVINERERSTLLKVEEILGTTNKSIAQQREQVTRLVQSGSTNIPPIVVKNAELSNSRRQKLMNIKHEQESIYDSQREVIKSGAMSLAHLPKLSPPSLLEVLASTSMPRPPMVPIMNIRPGMNPQMHPRMRVPFMSAPPPAVGAHGDGRPREPVSPEREVELESAAAPVSRRNAAETQLIQDIKSMFPRLTEEDVRGYISKLRQSRQGLTGLKIVELKRQIIELILQKSGQPATMTRENSVGEECTICSETLRNGPVRQLNCDHIFHNNCIGNWLNRQSTCPICRRPQ